MINCCIHARLFYFELWNRTIFMCNNVHHLKRALGNISRLQQWRSVGQHMGGGGHRVEKCVRVGVWVCVCNMNNVISIMSTITTVISEQGVFRNKSVFINLGKMVHLARIPPCF